MLSIDKDLGRSILTSLLVGFVSAWSCYIVSIGSILKSREVPTSLEGMYTTAQVGLGYGLCLCAIHYFLMGVPFSPLSCFVVIAGSSASCALQGFYIGYSKARLIAEEARAFIFRQIGLFISVLVLAGHLLISYRPDDEWVVPFLTILLVVTSAILVGLFFRAMRQRKRYLSRRYKQRSAAQPMATA